MRRTSSWFSRYSFSSRSTSPARRRKTKQNGNICSVGLCVWRTFSHEANLWMATKWLDWREKGGEGCVCISVAVLDDTLVVYSALQQQQQHQQEQHNIKTCATPTRARWRTRALHPPPVVLQQRPTTRHRTVRRKFLPSLWSRDFESDHFAEILQCYHRASLPMQGMIILIYLLLANCIRYLLFIVNWFGLNIISEFITMSLLHENV